ncbi:hypothetical protein O6P43_007370, partial [Quillaja saponaria]
ISNRVNFLCHLNICYNSDMKFCWTIRHVIWVFMLVESFSENNTTIYVDLVGWYVFVMLLFLMFGESSSYSLIPCVTIDGMLLLHGRGMHRMKRDLPDGI